MSRSDVDNDLFMLSFAASIQFDCQHSEQVESVGGFSKCGKSRLDVAKAPDGTNHYLAMHIFQGSVNHD